MHLVTLDPSGRVVYEATHPGKFGYFVDVELIHPHSWNCPAFGASEVESGTLAILILTEKSEKPGYVRRDSNEILARLMDAGNFFSP